MLAMFLALNQLRFVRYNPDYQNLDYLLLNKSPLTYVAVVLLRGFIYVVFFITSFILYSALKDKFQLED